VEYQTKPKDSFRNLQLYFYHPQISAGFLDQTQLFKNVVVAESVSVALMKIRNDYFDLVIVDYSLPDKNGTSFIDIISKSIKYRKVKFLLISGYLDHQAMMDVLNVGVKNVLVKPFSKTKLIHKTCDILKIEY
jgi:response regulator of citrate/malate metabolism